MELLVKCPDVLSDKAHCMTDDMANSCWAWSTEAGQKEIIRSKYCHEVDQGLDKTRHNETKVQVKQMISMRSRVGRSKHA